MAGVIGCTPAELWYALAQDRYPQYTTMYPALDRVHSALRQVPEEEWSAIASVVEMLSSVGRDQRLWATGLVQGALARTGVDEVIEVDESQPEA